MEREITEKTEGNKEREAEEKGRVIERICELLHVLMLCVVAVGERPAPSSGTVPCPMAVLRSPRFVTVVGFYPQPGRSITQTHTSVF